MSMTRFLQKFDQLPKFSLGGELALVETRSWGTKQECQNLVPTRASGTKLVPKFGTKFWHCSMVLQDHHSTSVGGASIIGKYAELTAPTRKKDLYLITFHSCQSIYRAASRLH
jgi:hypothetical protein